MHNDNEAEYNNFLNDIYAEYAEVCTSSKAAGIADDQIILNSRWFRKDLRDESG